MTTNMCIKKIEKNEKKIPLKRMFLEGKPSGCEREHSLLEDCPKECNHALMMYRIKYVYSFLYLDHHFASGKFLTT